MKNILIAGKDFPDGKEFSETASLKERSVTLTCTEKEYEVLDGEASRIILWNKSSPLSSRSLVLSCENFKGALDEAILYMDEPLLASLFENSGLQNCAKIIDDFIAGYQFLTFELISRKVKKIVFVHKTNMSLLENLLSSQARTSRISTPIISACGAAFESFAENIAAELSSSEIKTVLVKGDVTNETMAKDSVFSAWVMDYLDGIDGLKSPLSPKQTCSWVKPGAKVKSGLFH